MKLKTRKNNMERLRQYWEGVARQVGETDFRRHPETGQYLNYGVELGWRIYKNSKS